MLNASKCLVNVLKFKGNFETNKFGPQHNRNLVMPSHPKACDRRPWNEWKIECHFKIDKIYALINLNKKLQYVMVGA